MDIGKLEEIKAFAESLPPGGYSYISPENLLILATMALEAAKIREQVGAPVFGRLGLPYPKTNVTPIRRISDIHIGGELTDDFKEQE